MKCIYCGTDNNLKDRTATGGRCSKCNHGFAFEPTAMGKVKITDPMFKKTIDNLSVNNTLFFTPKQLLYSLERRIQPNQATAGVWVGIYIIFNIFATVAIGGALSQFFESPLIFFMVPFALMPLFTLGIYRGVQRKTVSGRDRRDAGQGLQLIGLLGLLVGIGVSAVMEFFPGYVITVLICMITIYVGHQIKARATGAGQMLSIEQSQLQAWMEKWKNIHAPIEKLLSPPKENNLPATVNPEVTAYSFDRLVVCDSANVAQVLIANNFHFENNCAVLSITGYPQNIFATTLGMVKRNPQLQVYAFHDCTPRGLGLVHRLRSSPTWFQNSNITIFDVGLHPNQIPGIKKSLILTSEESTQAVQQMPPEVRQQLTEIELKWLEAGNFVELESFSPQRLIQALNRGIASSRDLDGTTDDSVIFIGDSGPSLATGDSFG